MFERYTEKARRVIFYARYAASEYGSSYIEVEHLLLGIIRDSPGVIVAHASEEHKQTILETLQKSVDAVSVMRETIPTSVDLPLSDEGKHVLAHAAEQADRWGDRNITPEHLLFGLLAVVSTPACAILNKHGITAARMLGARETASAPFAAQPSPTTLVWFVDSRNVEIASASLTEFAPVPRIGETVWLGGDEKYGVVNIRYDFERRSGRAYQLNRVVVSLRRIHPPPGDRPLGST